MKRHLRPFVAACVATMTVCAIAVIATNSGEPLSVRTPASGTGAASPTHRPGPEVIGAPDRVQIETIGIDAAVIEVGTAPDNSQEVPTSLSEAGWWKDGRRPGQSGNAVLVGHTASREVGVFDRLDDIEAGDDITVYSGDQELDFEVTTVEDVPVSSFADVASDIYRTSGSRGIVLMTCGDWNGTDFESTVIVHATAA